ncbi:hypothetical protein EIP86_011310 [Pleurotus ostreatoroseus]|nr:hypothetical protein EIP86_011310 [Pleurotus ostreatoroseus]
MSPGLVFYSSPSPEIPDSPDSLDHDLVVQLRKGVPTPVDEANVRRWLRTYSDTLDALYQSSTRVDERALYEACALVRNQIALFAAESWAYTVIAKFPCLRSSSSTTVDAFSTAEMFASRFRDRRNQSASATPDHSAHDHEDTDHPNVLPPSDQIDLTVLPIQGDTPPLPSSSPPRTTQRRKTGITSIKSPKSASRRAHRPTAKAKAIATPPPTRMTTRSAKKGRTMPRPAPRGTKGPVSPKCAWIEHVPAGMMKYADFENPNDFCDGCWNIGEAERCVFTHPNICRRCQESDIGCQGHADIFDIAVESDEAAIPVPTDTKIPETTLDEQIDMMNSQSRKRKHACEHMDDYEHSEDEEVDELDEEGESSAPPDVVEDDTPRPAKRQRVSKLNVKVVAPTIADLRDSSRAPSAPADDLDPPPPTPRTWAELGHPVFTADKIARGREILFPVVIDNDLTGTTPSGTTFTVPAVLDDKTLYGTLMKQFEYYQSKTYTCKNMAAYLQFQMTQLRSGGMAALGIPAASPSQQKSARDEPGRATQSTSPRGRGRVRGGSSYRSGRGAVPLK